MSASHTLTLQHAYLLLFTSQQCLLGRLIPNVLFKLFPPFTLRHETKYYFLHLHKHGCGSDAGRFAFLVLKSKNRKGGSIEGDYIITLLNIAASEIFWGIFVTHTERWRERGGGGKKENCGVEG